MEIDSEKQFIEDVEVIIPNELEKEKEEEKTFMKPAKDLTQYGLVATVMRDNIVLLWEWKPLELARIEAKENFERMY